MKSDFRNNEGGNYMGKKHGLGFYIVGSIVLTVAAFCFMPKLQDKLANEIYRRKK